MEAGEEVVFLPAGAQARVKSIEVFNAQRASAVAEECIGITLDSPLSLDRGEIACAKDSPPVPTRRFRANVFWMSPEPCHLGEAFTVRAATQDIPCKIERIEKRIDSSTLAVLEENAGYLAETEVGQMIIATERPIVLETYQDIPELGRIVIGRGFDTVGGGLVTHATDAHL